MWKLRLDKAGIQVFTRPEPGSAFDRYRALMVAPGPATPYLALLHDIDNYTETLHATVAARLIQDKGDEKIIYIANQHPGVKSRDYYAHMRFTHDPQDGSYTVDWRLASGYPEDPKRVRLQALQSVTRLVPRADKQLDVSMEGHFEPGGIVPALIANRVIMDTPWNTLKNVRKHAQSKRYRTISSVG